MNDLGNIIASCPGCVGSTSTFEYIYQGKELGFIIRKGPKPYASYPDEKSDWQYRLFRCAGCGMGGLGCIVMQDEGNKYPGGISRLEWFKPEAKQRLRLPKDVPKGIRAEFQEGEKCIESGTFRAAAAMFRSVLDKTLRDNGYKTKGESLAAQIDEAAKDGVITSSRQRRAHDEIRVLGNDVLHDEWHAIPEEDVQVARQYCQRFLEDFYDDRVSVLKTLREAGRIPKKAQEKKKP